MWNNSPRRVRRIALVVGIGAFIAFAVLGYKAVSNEITGTALYQRYQRASRELVTRESAPEKFRWATNFLWATSGFCLLVSAGGFLFFRKLDENLDHF